MASLSVALTSAMDFRGVAWHLPGVLHRLPRPAWMTLLLVAFALSAGLAALRAPDSSAQSGGERPKSLDIIPGSVGVDVSWPQCDSQQLPQYHFDWAIIGVNGGRMTSYNDCLEGQYEWAKKAQVVPQVYMNTNAPQPSFVHANCGTEDAFCHAYWWGRSHTIATLQYARANNADALWWWLDVETANYWSEHTGFNAQVLAGAIHVLQETGHKVGIYSVPRMWRIIAGDYAPGLPVWTAGAADLEEAKTRCTDQYAFGGGKVMLVQYVSEEFDTNWACPGNIIRRLTVVGTARGVEHAFEAQEESPTAVPTPTVDPEAPEPSPTEAESPTATPTEVESLTPTPTETETAASTETPSATPPATEIPATPGPTGSEFPPSETATPATETATAVASRPAP